MGVLVTILIFAVVLAVLILSHEAGHALAAWISGCRVEEFGIGFPPRIFGKKIGETIFSINALPLGGFVRITGEDGDSENEETSIVKENPQEDSLVLLEETKTEIITERGTPRRILGLLQIKTLWGFIRTDKEGGDSTNDESSNIGKDSRSFANKKPPIKLFILLAGVGMNILLAFVCYTLIAGIGADIPTESSIGGNTLQNRRVEIVGIEKNAVLTGADISEGDILKEINGEPVYDSGTVTNKIKSFSGHELVLTLKRGQETKKTTLIFKGNHEVGKPVGLSLLDIATYKVAWWQAPIEGVKSTAHVVKMTAVGIGGLFGNLIVKREVPNDVAGPVGIASLVGSIGRQGILPLMELIAVLSVNLALINILPIPALDGGRALFVLVESAGIRFMRGKPERMAHTIGFALLILLVLLITINDIRRIIHP